LDVVLGGEVLVNVFGGTNAVFGGHPSEYILLFIRNWAHRGDSLYCLIIKSVIQKIHIPRLSIRDPKVGNY
jgi:hypothetical protein